MRSLVKLVRRYVLAGVGIALGVLILNVVIPFGVIFAVAYRSYFQLPFRPSQIADSFTLDETGTPRPGPEHTEEEWFYSFDWAMMLNDAGEIVYRYDLPAELDHPYTTREVVSFTRWYLEDYPVMCYLTDYGALVLGYPKGSLVRYSFYMESDLLHALLATVRPVILVDLLVIVLPCVLFAWGMHRRLRDVEQGLQELAAGRPVQLAEKGATAALARQLNQTGEHLRSQSERIARRDAARTDWIAGVSHDIRTPLALIFGHAEQLEQDPALPQAARAEAAAIRAQGQTIRSLIEDLNLTSKLEYDAQPLRRARMAAAPLLRAAVTDFCNSGAGEACTVDFALDPSAETAVLDADAALLRRAFANLLGNSARHNPGGCNVSVTAETAGGSLRLIFADDGRGYPPAVLAQLQGAAAPDAPAPHILGLYLVRQIVRAHGGQAAFAQNRPRGALCTLTLPLAPAGGQEPGVSCPAGGKG